MRLQVKIWISGGCLFPSRSCIAPSVDEVVPESLLPHDAWAELCLRPAHKGVSTSLVGAIWVAPALPMWNRSGLLVHEISELRLPRRPDLIAASVSLNSHLLRWLRCASRFPFGALGNSLLSNAFASEVPAA